MKPTITIEIEDEFLSALLTRLPAVGSLESVTKAVENFLSVGAVARIMQNGSLVKEFKLPGQFIDHVNSLSVSLVKCPNCQNEFRCAPGWISPSATVGCPKCSAVIRVEQSDEE